MTTPLDPALLELYQSANQQHIFAFYDTLTEPQRQQLLSDARHINPHSINAHYTAVTQLEQAALSTAAAQSDDIRPFTAVTVLKDTPAAERQRWYEEGLRAIAVGQVAAVLMAGGQGTRLGSSAPKGCYDIGLPSQKSLFALQADRIHRIKQLAAQLTTTQLTAIHLPWYIMTSLVTHHPTLLYFQQHGYFGLPQEDVHFFQQSELPALSFDGRILLESASKLALSPNGNGGIFDALHTSGCLADMAKRGVTSIHTYGVDNVLIRVADPTLIGYARLHKAECVNKVVLKEEPSEKVGVMCVRAGVPHVVEYSELPKAMAELRDATTGRLVYSAANIVQQYFTLPFLQSVATQPLPLHMARKAVPFIDPAGVLQQPSQPNAIKLEMFNFDIFARSPSMHALAVERTEEFSGVKNKSGVDSPDTARQAVGALHRRWVVGAGGAVEEGDGGGGVVEVSGFVSYAGEGLESVVKGKQYRPPVLIS